MPANNYLFIIIEDVRLMLDYAVSLISKRSDLSLMPMGAFSNYQKAYDFLTSPTSVMPDIIFVDVELPGSSNGFDLLKQMQNLPKPHPKVILTTAHAEYAIEGYQYTVSGYVAKPLREDYLNDAIDKAIKTIEDEKELNALIAIANKTLKKGKTKRDSVLINKDGKSVLVYFKDIVCCEAEDVYVKIHLKDQKTHLTRMSLGKSKNPNKGTPHLGDLLPDNQFIQVHEKFIVAKSLVKGWKNLSAVDLAHSFKSNYKHPDGDIGIGPSFRPAFKDWLISKGWWTKF